MRDPIRKFVSFERLSFGMMMTASEDASEYRPLATVSRALQENTESSRLDHRSYEMTVNSKMREVLVRQHLP